jgi:hypothetical protein
VTEPAYSVTPYEHGVRQIVRAADAPPPIPSRRRPSPVPAAGGVELVRISSVVMAAALELAGGDPRRLVLNADGSVTVLNGVRR